MKKKVLLGSIIMSLAFLNLFFLKNQKTDENFFSLANVALAQCTGGEDGEWGEAVGSEGSNMFYNDQGELCYEQWRDCWGVEYQSTCQEYYSVECGL